MLNAQQMWCFNFHQKRSEIDDCLVDFGSFLHCRRFLCLNHKETGATFKGAVQKLRPQVVLKLLLYQLGKATAATAQASASS